MAEGAARKTRCSSNVTRTVIHLISPGMRSLHGVRVVVDGLLLLRFAIGGVGACGLIIGGLISCLLVSGLLVCSLLIVGGYRVACLRVTWLWVVGVTCWLHEALELGLRVCRCVEAL